MLLYAIDNNQTILVYYDNDVDGTSGGSIAYRYLRNYTDNVRTYIAKGMTHGLEGLPLSELDGVDVLWSIGVINTNLIDVLKPLLNDSGKLSGRISVGSLYCIK